MPTKSICFEQEAFAGKVSPKGFQDVSLLTGGMEAEGHGIYLDEKSVETCMAAVMGRSVPSYLTHAGASSDRLGKEIGVASGAYRDGLKVRASNLNFLDSFGRHDPATRDRLVELASTYPDQLGVSLVLSYNPVWVMHDGSELSAEEPRPENAVRDVPSARVVSVRSADLVQRPAANVGLFSKKEAPVDDAAKAMPSTIELEKHTAELAALSASHKTALEKQAADHTAALAAKDAAHVAALAAKEKELTDTKAAHVAALAAKDVELVELAKFDVRKSGGTAATITLGNVDGGRAVLPEPALKDHQRWAQFEELQAKDPKIAAEFKEKYLTRK